MVLAFSISLQITCSGPVVMTGYRKNQKANDEVFYQHEGARYFRTGDMGRMVEGKFLKITGRIKEQFKLENGKYVVPAPLEDVFTRSPYILQLFICGTNHPHPIALVVPNWANLLPWCEKKGLSGKAPTAAQLADVSLEKLDIFDEPAFKDLINQEVCMPSLFISFFAYFASMYRVYSDIGHNLQHTLSSLPYTI